MNPEDEIGTRCQWMHGARTYVDAAFRAIGIDQPNMTIPRAAQVVFVDQKTALDGFPWQDFSNEDVQVWCLATDYDTSLILQQRLPSELSPTQCHKTINAIARRVAEDVANLDSQVFPHAYSTLWDATDLAERSPYNSPLFLNCCWAIALLEALHSGKKIVAVTKSTQVSSSMATITALAGHTTHVVEVNRIRGRIRKVVDLVRLISAALRVRAHGILDFINAKKTIRRLRQGDREALQQLADADVLLVTWATHDTFRADGVLDRSHFYGALPSLLRELGAKVGYLAMPMYWIEPFEGIARNVVMARDAVVLLEECLHLYSVLKAAALSLFFPLRVRWTLRLDGHDLSPLIKLALKQELCRWRPTLAIATRDVAGTLRRNGIAPPHVVHLYENQPWEKTLRAGFRAALPQTQTIALQHVPFSENSLDYFPSNRDIRLNNLPDRLVVIGSKWHRFYRDRGYPESRVNNGGSLRYEWLLSDAAQVGLSRAPRRTVLCCSEIASEWSFQLVHKSVSATRDMQDVRLVVNFHPVTSSAFREFLQRKVAQFASGSMAHVEFTVAAARDLVPHADVVLYNASTSGLEAVARGVPVVNVGHDGDIDLDRVPEEMTKRCHSVAEIRRAIEEYLDHGRIVGAKKIKIRNHLQQHMDEVKIDFWRSVISEHGGHGPHR